MCCETCNDNFYIETLNTETNRVEIQRCDECAIFASDAEARKTIEENNPVDKNS